MKTEKQIANVILPAALNEAQIARVIKNAAEDAQNWKKEAQNGTLPNIEEMHLDWDIDQDLIDAGVNDYVMQRLSFAFAEAQ